MDVFAPWAGLETLAEQGMLSAHYASERPREIAIYSAQRNVSFETLNDRANRLASALASRGISVGDAVAIVSPNRIEFAETYLACLRMGLRLTPVSPRFGPAEASHIVAHCNARVLILAGDVAPCFADAALPDVRVRLAFGAVRPGFEVYENVLGASSGLPPAEPKRGYMMFYTSGTTGQPKGIHRPQSLVYRPQGAGTLANYRPGDVNLLCGPAYHSASFYYDVALPLASGAPIVMMERFDPLEFLERVAAHGVTHTHMVSTMFHRLLRLPQSVRVGYDLSSLRLIMHGGAPTPVAVKRAMIDWVGPVLHEYYAATEGSSGVRISAADWLKKPGSVGKVNQRSGLRIIDDRGKDCEPGVVGEVLIRNGVIGARAVYYRDPKETERVLSADHFTVGDRGYIDADGYLFLTGRSADRIISGGVNIDPQEIDNVLLAHPSVLECCCVGAPNEEWGEEVRAVIVADGAVADRDRLSCELMDWVRDRLAHYKAPRSIDFVDAIPQTESGKIQRAIVRAGYWKDRAAAI